MGELIYLPNLHRRSRRVLAHYLDQLGGEAKFEMVHGPGGIYYRTSVFRFGEKHVSEAADPIVSVKNLCWMVGT